MRIFHLYRPRLPGLRAQAIQVLQMCRALAEEGHEVTLLADRAPEGASPEAALGALGLEPHPGLRLALAPVSQPGLAGLWFRWGLSRWAAGPPGLVYARDKRRLAAALGRLGGRHRIVLETHELDSALAAEAGADSAPVRALEAGLLPHLDGLVANCGGTLRAWEEAYGEALPRHRRALHNGTAPDRLGAEAEPRDVIRVMGSLRSFKGPETVLAAARRAGLPIELIGGSAREQAALGPPPPGLRFVDPVPYTAVPAWLQGARVLLLPLADNLFGRQLTSPLKLWDYLAATAPIVAPRLPSVEEISALMGVPFIGYPPGDADALAAALTTAWSAPRRRPTVRTWAQRAQELSAFLAEVSR